MRIETARLVLRDFIAEDEAVMHVIRQHPRFREFYDDEIATLAFTHRLQLMFLDYQRAAPRRKFQLAVTLHGDDTPIGSAGIRRKDTNEFEADIGYELAVEHWSRGYATEAAGALVDYGFESLGLTRISSWCLTENRRSARVLEKVGMSLEGRLRANEHFKGRWWDTSLYAILRDEWELLRSDRYARDAERRPPG
jgi:RimJ/RimL family protein N-acetyltransferase